MVSTSSGKRTRNSSKDQEAVSIENLVSLNCSGEGMSEAESVTNTMNGDTLVGTAVTGHCNSGFSPSYMDKLVNYL